MAEIKKAGREEKSKSAKNRILSACVKMFVENGYNNTTMLHIIEEANVSASSFQNLFKTKDGVLKYLAEAMFENQFDIAGAMVESDIKKTPMLYAIETAIQLTIAEQNENLREIYVEAYSSPEIVEYIRQRTSTELYHIFSPYLPNYSESDFYELEIGTSSIMLGYMGRKTDKYFTLKRKIERFLRMTLSAFDVPLNEKENIIKTILGLDLESMAHLAIKKVYDMLEMKFDVKLEAKF